MARAIATPMMPEIKKRNASENRGDASATMIRADVKADDQIRAKVSPIAMARRSISISLGGRCAFLKHLFLQEKGATFRQPRILST